MLSLPACHPPHNGTLPKLTTVQYASSSTSGGSRGAKKKANLLYRWRSCGKVARHSRVREEASLRWLTSSRSVTLVSGLEFDASCPVGTVSNIYKVDIARP